MIEQIDATGFETKVKGSTAPAVVDFFGKTCPPCAKLLPVVEDVAKEFAGRVSFFKADIEDVPDAASEHGIWQVPTVLFFRDGCVVDRFSGLVPRSKLASCVRDLLQ